MADMNRRGFIGTLTALAGLALAKIKAPAEPLRPGVAWIKPTPPITAVRRIDGGLVVFSQNKAYTYHYSDPYGWREWKHPVSSQYGRLLTLNDYGSLVDTCKYCGSQAHPGYDLICCCNPQTL